MQDVIEVFNSNLYNQSPTSKHKTHEIKYDLILIDEVSYHHLKISQALPVYPETNTHLVDMLSVFHHYQK
jgi:hypothetical protein